MLIWQDPCFWEEIVLLRVDSTHAHQVPCKVVFARDTVDPWVHVYLLIRQHFWQEIRSDRQVVPAEVPHRSKLLPSDSVDDSPIMVFLVVLHPKVTNFAAYFFLWLRILSEHSSSRAVFSYQPLKKNCRSCCRLQPRFMAVPPALPECLQLAQFFFVD